MNRNEEKLKILRDRLRQIKEKDDSIITQEDHEAISPETESIPDQQSFQDHKKTSSPWLKYIITVLIIGGVVYSLNTVGVSDIIKKIKTAERIGFIVGNEKSNTSDQQIKKMELEYNLKKLINQKGEICIVTNMKTEEEAKEITENLIAKGFKASYFFSPDYSNNNQEIYEVFIGPYENQNELNQWEKNIFLNKEQEKTRITL